MFRRGYNDGVDVWIGQDLLKILVRFGRVAAHGLYAVLRAREISLVGVAYRDHLNHVLAAHVEPLHQVITAAADADPSNLGFIVGSQSRKNAGRAHDREAGGRFHKGAAGRIVCHLYVDVS